MGQAYSAIKTARLLSSAASTNDTLVKAAQGWIFAIHGYNSASAVRYLKLYNLATTPTVGTSTPFKTIALPPQVAFALDYDRGYEFDIGLGYGLTTGSADNDTGAVGAGDILGLNIDYV